MRSSVELLINLCWIGEFISVLGVLNVCEVFSWLSLLAIDKTNEEGDWWLSSLCSSASFFICSKKVKRLKK